MTEKLDLAARKLWDIISTLASKRCTERLTLDWKRLSRSDDRVLYNGPFLDPRCRREVRYAWGVGAGQQHEHQAELSFMI
jgi:hypothetical protein